MLFNIILAVIQLEHGEVFAKVILNTTLRAIQLVISAPIQSLLELVVIRDLLRAVSYCVYEC